MTPLERKVTEEQLAKFKASLADPWRTLRSLERGHDPIIVEAETRSLRSMVDNLEEQLRNAELKARGETK